MQHKYVTIIFYFLGALLVGTLCYDFCIYFRDNVKDLRYEVLQKQRDEEAKVKKLLDLDDQVHQLQSEVDAIKRYLKR